MNITHIMAQTMYTQDMYMLINTCFDGTEHKFCTGHAKRKDSLAPVSYTHLTLPTILRV